ncbi:MAG TPA: BatA domain-containing protein [Gemmataceae bacterium]|nr:BatA domain-containing protein [Gemmataceae bacterium]
MLESLFLNPAALTVGGAMVSSPILIHLINRMRFKRLRWAAMEFLLKSQKRNRRRLIIEQLLLLLLRCILIFLAGVLLSRFIGCTGVFGGASNFEQKPNLHVILLDDTLSMHDKVKDKDDCFKAAKRDILDAIARNVSQSSTDDGVVILRPSDILNGSEFQPKAYSRLNDPNNYKELETDIAAMECTKLRFSLLERLQKIKQIADTSDSKLTIHVLSDFRKSDWAGPTAKDLHKVMLDLGTHDNVKKLYLIDTSHPTREPEQGGVPAYHDNIGIVEVRPSTRVTSNGSTVQVVVTIVNYSPRDASVEVVPFNNATGLEIREKDYETPMPVKVPAGKTAQAVFSFPVRLEIKDGDDKGFYRLGVRLQRAGGLPLESDGLAEDDVRHAAIEVRRSIPVLIIDGKGEEGRQFGGDSFHVASALKIIAGSKYEVDYGHKLVGGDAREALESPDLANYTSIMLFNVPKLEDKQRVGLERFVKNGGGVCFFMGPDVQAKHYNEDLYRKGNGLFPVPIADTFHPMAGVKLLPPEFTGRYQVLLRDDQFPKTEKIPIFGPVFKQPRLRDFLKYLPVQRYWPALPLNEWAGEPGQVREVANLPNEEMAGKFANEVSQFVKTLPVDRPEYREYRNGLALHGKNLLSAVSSGTKVPAYKVAELVDRMLVDRGKDSDKDTFPNLVEFWDLRDPLVQDLKRDAMNLRKTLLYSSPLVVVKDFGRGRVVAWMTTAGKEWNLWPDGITGTIVYAPLIYELQNYLTSQSGDSGQTVGSTLNLTVDGKRFDANRTLKIARIFSKPVLNKPEVPASPVSFQGAKEKGAWTFKLDNALEPGFYASNLLYGDGQEAAKPPIWWGHAYNVDTTAEGNLQRVSQEEMESAFMRQAGGKVGWRRVADVTVVAINRPWDLSEWPVFFLIFICILIFEQALAVHLSSHLRTGEAELPAQVATPRAKAA